MADRILINSMLLLYGKSLSEVIAIWSIPQNIFEVTDRAGRPSSLTPRRNTGIAAALRK